MNWKLGLALTLLLSPALTSAATARNNAGFEDTDAANGEDLEEEDDPLAWADENSIYEDEDTIPPSWLNSEEELLSPSDLASLGDLDVLNGLESSEGNQEDGDVISPIQKRSRRRRRRGRRKSPPRRFCFGMGMSCSAAPGACCDNYYCRCNIFGSNCKCDRAGLLFG